MGRYFQISIAIVTDVCRDRFRYLSQLWQTSVVIVSDICRNRNRRHIFWCIISASFTTCYKHHILYILTSPKNK